MKKILILFAKKRRLGLLGDYVISLPEAGDSVLTKIYRCRQKCRSVSEQPKQKVQVLLQEKIAYALEELLELMNTSEH